MKKLGHYLAYKQCFSIVEILNIADFIKKIEKSKK